jgi:hypothetical protein
MEPNDEIEVTEEIVSAAAEILWRDAFLGNSPLGSTPHMNGQKSNDDERRDALLLRLLKRPPGHAPSGSAPTKAYSVSRQARQRRKARASCLGVRGFVRLSIEESLTSGTSGTAQRSVRAPHRQASVAHVDCLSVFFIRSSQDRFWRRRRKVGGNLQVRRGRCPRWPSIRCRRRARPERNSRQLRMLLPVASPARAGR